MKGIGIDIEEIERFKKIRHFERFLTFVFTVTEIDNGIKAADKYAYFASRFAAKEAVIKAVKGKYSYLDFEINKNGNVPIVNLLERKSMVEKFFLSISHNYSTAIGVAVAE